MPHKILLIGPVSGRLAELNSKVSAIQSKHGPFVSLFVLGDLFHPSPSETLLREQTDLLEGKFKLPIPTYFYQGTSPLPQPVSDKVTEGSASGLVQVIENLYYARGKSGVFATKEGFRVAFVGGIWDANKYAETSQAENSSNGKEFSPEDWFESDLERTQDEQVAHITPATIYRLLAHPSFHLPSQSSSAPPIVTNGASVAKPGTLAAARASASAEQAKSAAHNSALQLLSSRPPIDLLLTNCWPTGVTLLSTLPSSADPTGGLPDPTARSWGSPAIARLASHACPRYHFALGPLPSSPDLPVGISEETVEMGAFWERPPYLTDLSSYLPNQAQQLTPQEARQKEWFKSVTRFVSLARFANEKKKRWFLALNLTPAEQQAKDGQAGSIPANATQTLYFVPSTHKAENGGKRSVPSMGAEELDAGPNFRFADASRHKRQRAGEGGEDVPPQGYVCRICGVKGHYIRLCPSKPQAQTNAVGPAADSNSVASNRAEPKAGGWTRSTMPLPLGLPSKPTFDQHQHHPKRQMIPVGPSNCWFCLSNPSVAKSLLITIGSESYLVFPKGPFCHPSINAIPHSASHLLIVPLTHTSNLLPPMHPVLSSNRNAAEQNGGEEEEERKRVRLEMHETKQTVRQIWAEWDHAMLEWTLVRVRTSSRMTHFQTQLLALLDSVVRKADLVKCLDDALDAQVSNGRGRILRNETDIQAYFAGNLEQIGGGGAAAIESNEEEDGYFHLVLYPVADEQKVWLVPLTTTSRFPVQFVRTTLAKVLDLAQLADWKSAIQPEQQTEDQERENSAGFRAMLLSHSS